MLNQDREETRRGNYVRQGTYAAMSESRGAPPDEMWYDTAVDDPEYGKYLHDRAIARAAAARSVAGSKR